MSNINNEIDTLLNDIEMQVGKIIKLVEVVKNASNKKDKELYEKQIKVQQKEIVSDLRLLRWFVSSR